MPRSMRDAIANPVKKQPRTALPAPVPAPIVRDFPSDGEVFLPLQHRIESLEKVASDVAAVVEQHEISLREREENMSSIAQSVMSLCERVEQLERSHAQEIASLRAALDGAQARLTKLEEEKAALENAVATLQAAPPSVASSASTSTPAMTPLRGTNMLQEKKSPTADATSAPVDPVMKDAPQSYLTSARRAAMAGAPAGKPAASAPSRRMPKLQYVAAGVAAPLVVAATATFVMNRHPVAAKAVPVPAAVKPATQAAPLAPPPDILSDPLAPPSHAELNSTTPASLQEKADAGDAKAERDLALKYLTGDGVAVNQAEAARWLLTASYRGEAVAEYWLGALYAQGQGVPADPAQAYHWYSAAAKHGNRAAMQRLGLASFDGQGTDKNPEEAAAWFTKAAEHGQSTAQFDLAIMYERGLGVPHSMSDAYKWYAVAAAGGNADASARMNAISKAMKPEEVAQASHAASEFKPVADEAAAAAAKTP